MPTTPNNNKRPVSLASVVTPTHEKVKLFVNLDYLSGVPVSMIELSPSDAVILGIKLISAAETVRERKADMRKKVNNSIHVHNGSIAPTKRSEND